MDYNSAYTELRGVKQSRMTGSLGGKKSSSNSTSQQHRYRDKQREGEKQFSADSDRFYSQAMRNEIKGTLGEQQAKAEDKKAGEGDVLDDDVNIKRSIEMKNGIALRSMNNFHKGTNAISLNNYKVSSGCKWR